MGIAMKQKQGQTLFGTDGIRCRAGEFPLTPHGVRRVVDSVLSRLVGPAGAPFFVARDTRASGAWIRDVVLDVVESRGVPSSDLGVFPTPAAVAACVEMGARGGVVVSASHNSAPDNGLKFITSCGDKIPDDLEQAVSGDVLSLPGLRRDPFEAPPQAPCETFLSDPGWTAWYIGSLKAWGPREPSASPPVVVDCANGAGSPVADAMVRAAGFPMHLVHHRPDGRNINEGCGATHPESLSAEVVKAHAAMGFALDGDGDRIVAVDGSGRVLDGDALLFAFAMELDRQGALARRTVVGTVMTNSGLDAALGRVGISLVRTPVGDRHVQAAMRKGGFSLGGEPSGHVILGPASMTGDGLLAGLFLWQILEAARYDAGALTDGYTPYPSRVFNIVAQSKPPLDGFPEVVDMEAAAMAAAGGKARVFSRYSGTEPLLRVLVEAESLDVICSAIHPFLRRIEEKLCSAS